MARRAVLALAACALLALSCAVVVTAAADVDEVEIDASSPDFGFGNDGDDVVGAGGAAAGGDEDEEPVPEVRHAPACRGGCGPRQPEGECAYATLACGEGTVPVAAMGSAAVRDGGSTAPVVALVAHLRVVSLLCVPCHFPPGHVRI